MAADEAAHLLETRVLPVEVGDLGLFKAGSKSTSVDTWQLLQSASASYQTLKDAASYLQTSSIPVAFPTETVYGLGADATRSEAVKGIYRAKGRPSDNPLISHVCDLDMLRDILSAGERSGHGDLDPIPEIYKPLIDQFWPGPLTILLPNPPRSRLAPEVTAGLKSFGVRMPDSPLALSLIKLAGVPLAAPSANASTKPSPTTAQHVLHDLNGRIEIILDGGPCHVGVESTVVDGLCDPPVVLRPGGLSLDRIRQCRGWERTIKGYKDSSELGSAAPRAPGMKYKHYSPKAKVILCEGASGVHPSDIPSLHKDAGLPPSIPTSQPPALGIVRTRTWKPWGGLATGEWCRIAPCEDPQTISLRQASAGHAAPIEMREAKLYNLDDPPLQLAYLVEVELGTDMKDIAHGLFAALRDLDRRDVAAIFVEGVDDEGDIGAAVMNRLRKAATEVRC
ncbi:MAG: hypothetical protein M1818_004990 [Claussenomyces sp. TS43310]|nr:MAG: hypothetical protein M1818_004990 [Claussenomyces sp. TS43310]